jgi:hypothetical protein
MASEAMSNARYPTIAQSLPFFYLLIQRLNGYLDVKNLDETPDFSKLEKQGKSGVITKAAWLAKKKLLKYFYMSSDADAIHSVATSTSYITHIKYVIYR